MAHNRILERLTEITTKTANKEIDLQDLNNLMADWLLTHLLKEDMLLGEYLQQIQQ